MQYAPILRAATTACPPRTKGTEGAGRPRRPRFPRPEAPNPGGSPPSVGTGGKRRGAPRGHLPLPPAARRPSRRARRANGLRRQPHRCHRAPPPQGEAPPAAPPGASRLPRVPRPGRGPGPNPGAGARARAPPLTFLGGVHLVWGSGGDAAARLPLSGPEPSGRGGEGGRGRREEGAEPGPDRCLYSGAREESRGRREGERERETG